MLKNYVIFEGGNQKITEDYKVGPQTPNIGLCNGWMWQIYLPGKMCTLAT